MTQDNYRKVTPQSGGAGVPPTVIFGLVIVGAVLLGLAIIIALVDRNNADEVAALPTLTPIPLPTLADGTTMATGDVFFVTQDIAFSLAAIADTENEDLIAPICTRIEVINHPTEEEGIVAVDADNAYWVYAADEEGNNGWLPLAVLAELPPEGCE